MIFKIMIILAISFSSVIHLESKIRFGSKGSEFNILGNSKLTSTNNINISGGTFGVDSASNISSGGDLNLLKGFLNVNDTEIKMTGIYGAGSGQVRLHGNHSIQVEPGTILGDVDVKGTGNRLEGAPLFSDDVDFSIVVNTGLTIAINNALNKNINLNGGTITLDSDLCLSNNVVIGGDSSVGSSGIISSKVVFNGFKLIFGSFYDEGKWKDALNFDSANIELKGNAVLGINAQWQFSNSYCFMNGNGAVLDLSKGAIIKIADGATLYLHDTYLKGIKENSIQFGGANSKIVVTNSIIEVIESFESTEGTIQVDSPSTFVLRDKNWTFKNSSKLIINDRLNLDVYDDPEQEIGQIKIGDKPLFLQHTWNDEIAISGDNLEVKDKGLVREITDRALSVIHFFDSPVTQDVVLDKPVFVVPERRVKVEDNVTLNGQGTTIEFSRLGYYESGIRKGAQFIVDSGKTVKLENICLSGITNNTFDIAGTIEIGDDVSFELADDVMLNSGTIKVGGTDNIFTIRGLAGKKKLILSSSSKLDLKNSSVLLQNLELIDDGGIHIVADSASASVALGGNSTFDVYSKSFNVNFNIEDINNELVFFEDNSVYGGTIAFDGIAAVNELAVHVIGGGTSIASTTGGVVEGAGSARLNLGGDPGIYLIGDGNVSVLEFTNYDITLNNQNANAFYVDDDNDGSSILIGKTIRTDAGGFDIKQAGRNLNVDLKYAYADFDTDFVRGRTFPLTAFGRKRRSEYNKLRKVLKSKLVKKRLNIKEERKRKNYIKPDFSKKKSKKKNTLINLQTRSRGAEDIPSLDLPDNVDQEVNSGNVHILQKSMRTNMDVNKGGVLENFYTHQKEDGIARPFNLTLKDSTISQSSKNSVKLEEKQIINVVGKSTINVSGLFEINKNFHIDDDASLTFSALKLNDGDTSVIPTVVIASNTTFIIPQTSTVKFDGVNLVLSNGSKILFYTDDDCDSILDLFKSNTNVSGDFIISKDDFTVKKRIGILELSGLSSLFVENYKEWLSENKASIEGVGFVNVSGGSSIVVPCPELGVSDKNVLEIAPNQKDRLVFYFNSSLLKVGKETVSSQLNPSIVEDSGKGLAQVLTGQGETAWYLDDNSSLNILSTGLFGLNIRNVGISGQLRSFPSRVITRGDVSSILQYLDDGIVTPDEMEKIDDIVGITSTVGSSTVDLGTGQTMDISSNNGYVAAFFGSFNISQNGILSCGENVSGKTFSGQIGLDKVIGNGIVVYLGENNFVGQVLRPFSVVSVYNDLTMSVFVNLFLQSPLRSEILINQNDNIEFRDDTAMCQESNKERIITVKDGDTISMGKEGKLSKKKKTLGVKPLEKVEISKAP